MITDDISRHMMNTINREVERHMLDFLRPLGLASVEHAQEVSRRGHMMCDREGSTTFTWDGAPVFSWRMDWDHPVSPRMVVTHHTPGGEPPPAAFRRHLERQAEGSISTT